MQKKAALKTKPEKLLSLEEARAYSLTRSAASLRELRWAASAFLT